MPKNKSYFTFHCPYGFPENFIPLRIVSIDPARLNLAVRVSENFSTIFLTKYSINGELYSTLIDILESQKSLLLSCQVIIIEKQLKINTTATRIMQHLISHFYLMFQKTPFILIEVDAKLKNTLFPKGDCKIETIKKALELSSNDPLALKTFDYFKSKKVKQDDIADTICQEYALVELLLGYENPKKDVLLLIDILKKCREKYPLKL